MSEPAASLQTWQEQVCSFCDGELFIVVVKLRSKPGGGFTTAPGGYVCRKCGTKADIARMQRETQRHQRMQELRALEAEEMQDQGQGLGQETS
jgi:hypothetical protein